jgi:DNA mismatch repair protein MutS2
VALVDHFRAAGAFTLASTHLTALKIYGANTKTVLNASMGFDEETLDPTYQLQIGLPGKSAGLDIAARLGMPEDILKRARASLSTQEIELSQLIADLHKRLEDVSLQKVALERERLNLAARERQINLNSERQLTAKLRDLETRFDELQRRWQDRADETLAKIAETTDRRKAIDQAQRQASKLTREMREDWETSIVPAQGSTSSASADAPRKLRIEEGVRVRVKGLRDLARVRRALGNGRFEVEAGFMKLQISGDDVEEVFPELPGGTPAKLPKNVRFQPGPELSPSVQEINIIGERADEAMDRVERFLDSAVMATAARVRIVHGHGMGILKRAVQDLLKKNPHVEKFYPGSQFEGGAGATIVELKE